MQGELLALIVFCAAGALMIVGAVLDWDWFMNTRRTRFFIAIFGRMVTRIIYLLLGMFFIGFAVFSYLG
ncbi:MAG: immunity 17 family protein [Chloroflexi bacterium]|nr:immunity 17 family protein [Chloroflexota bacterium]